MRYTNGQQQLQLDGDGAMLRGTAGAVTQPASGAGNTAMAISPVSLPTPVPVEGMLTDGMATDARRGISEGDTRGTASPTRPVGQIAGSAATTAGAEIGAQLAKFVPHSLALQAARELFTKLQPSQRHDSATSAGSSFQGLVQEVLAGVAGDEAFLTALRAHGATQAKLVEISDAFEEGLRQEDEVGRKRMLPSSNGSMVSACAVHPVHCTVVILTVADGPHYSSHCKSCARIQPHVG